MPRIPKAIKEAYRVLNKGGILKILEFSKVENEYLRKFYDLYNFNIVPAMGEAITGDRKSY